MLLFCLNASRPWAEKVADKLQLPLAEHEERDFPDGESKVRPLVRVRNQDVSIIHSLHADASQTVNDKLCRLLFFIGAVKDAGAARIQVVIPYLAYARKDQRTQFQDPLCQRYVVQLLETMGMSTLMTLDIHNRAALECATRVPVVHLQAVDLLARRIDALTVGQALVVVSPDTGGVKRATAFVDALSNARGEAIPLAHVDKRRSQGQVSGSGLIGSVTGRTAVIVDDMISSGITARRAIEQLHQHGAERIIMAVSHCLDQRAATELLNDSPLQHLLVTDSIGETGHGFSPGSEIGHPGEGRAGVKQLEQISVAELFAAAIDELQR